MAVQTLSGLRQAENEIIMARDRQRLVLEAVCEISELAGLLPGAAPLAVRGLVARIRELVNIATSGLSDELHPTADLARILSPESERL